MNNEISLEMLIVFVVGTPLAVGIWLIAGVLTAKKRIEELNRRVDDLQAQIVLLSARSEQATEQDRKANMPSAAAANITSTEKFTKPATETTTATPPKNTSAPPAEMPPIIPPLVQPPPLPSVSPAAPNWFPKLNTEPVTSVKQPIVPEAPPLISAREDNTQKPADTETSTTASSVPAKASFEMRLGTFWLVRVGIVMLLTGLVFFGNYAYHNIVGNLGPAGKDCLLYVASGLLLGAGVWWQRRSQGEGLRNYAQVLFAGGLAAVYFTTYAAYHLPTLQIIHSAIGDGTLLFIWAGMICWMADYRKSETMALFGVGLAFYSSVITRVGDFTLYSNLVLTIAAVVFLLRNRWASLSFAGLVTSYAGYAFWRFLHEDGWRWATPNEGLNFGAAFLAAYWIVFTAATFLSRHEKLSGANRAAFLTLNNSAFFSLFILTMIQVQSGGFWKFSLGYGTTLLALAALAQKLLAGELMTKRSYLVQGLLLITLGIISKFSGLQLSLILGAESVVLFTLGSQRQSLILKSFGAAAAMLATGWWVANLKPFAHPGLWTGVSLGGLLLINTGIAHRQATEKNSSALRMAPTFFTLLAFIGWLATTWFNTSEANLPLALAAEAVLLTLSIYLLRIPEIALCGQGFLVLAQLAALYHISNSTPPWWNPLAVIVTTIGLSHWWQKQKRLVAGEMFSLSCQTIFAVAVVALVLAWSHSLMDAPTWLIVTSFLAVITTAYGVMTRAWPLAAFGQIFLAVSIWKFFTILWTDEPAWYFPLAPITVLAMLSFAAGGWFKRHPASPTAVRKPILEVALVYRWAAMALSLCWLWQYVHAREHVWAFMSVTSGLFALAIWKNNREALFATAIYAAVSLGALWAVDDLAMDIYWPNLLALLALLAMQQVLRHRAAVFAWPVRFTENIHAGIILITGLSLWRFLSCWVATFTGGFLMTMIWAGFAVLLFAVGIILRERFHRWFGLGVLAAAVGRVVLVDVWREETIYRVLTFMALGVALLVIGFIYNKFQEKIRLWL